jgi:hypothetical protein
MRAAKLCRAVKRPTHVDEAREGDSPIRGAAKAV